MTGPQRFDGAPWIIDGARGYERWRPTPMLGEHNDEVLESLLGWTPDTVKRLSDTGVLFIAPPQ